MAQSENTFYLMVTGQIESCEISGCDNLYCTYSLAYGKEWELIQGIKKGLSQTSRINANSKYPFLWNYPFDLTFKSYNPHGWPQMLIAIYSYNSWSQDIIVGYTSVRIPMFSKLNNTSNNTNTNIIESDLYRPISSNTMSEFISWIKGNPPEYYDITTIAKSDVREVTRVKSNGKVRISFNVITKNLKSFGYSIYDETITQNGINLINNQNNITLNNQQDINNNQSTVSALSAASNAFMGQKRGTINEITNNINNNNNNNNINNNNNNSLNNTGNNNFLLDDKENQQLQ